MIFFSRERRVTPEIEPGYLSNMISLSPPNTGEKWDKIMSDVESKIMPGVTHWQHPSFHAYFPAGNSYPSILGDMLSSGLGIIGFSWSSSPACTELETIVIHWLGKMSGLHKSLLPFEENEDNTVDKPCSNYKKEINPILTNKENIQIEVKSVQEENSMLHAGGGVLLVKINI